MSENEPTLKSDPTVRAFFARHDPFCAGRTLTFFQTLRYQALLLLLALAYAYDWKLFVAGALFACSAFYVLTIGYRLLTVLLSLIFRPEVRIDAEAIRALRDEDLPVYTVLVPLYKEPEIAAKVVRAVNGLDYPHDKLDVKLLLEEDDRDTVAACRAVRMPDCVEVIVVPHAMPKTKPKACNHGLARARGTYTVIFDAEDRPDCDQLKKAVLAFDQVPPHVACLQAKLNYYNPDQNLLTQWFTLEYSAWFDLYLPGLHKLDVPIPLGGTSNHFRTSVLRDLGGWDPFNLTEDCDLGIRLHRHGWRTQTLDSTTWEEANSRLGNWIRQRSRWVKGYIQSHLVHARSNASTLFALGPKSFLSFLLTVGGLGAVLLLNPIFWIVGGTYLILAALQAAGQDIGPWRMVYTDTVSDLPGSPLTAWARWSYAFWLAAVGLCTANGFFVLIHIIACAKRGLWRLAPQALLTPLYWVLISVAAWKGFLQLFTKPFYWEKTLHGLTDADEGACHLPEDQSARQSAPQFAHESAQASAQISRSSSRLGPGGEGAP